MKKRLFVTGLSGFVGQHLKAYLDRSPELGWRLVETERFDLLRAEALDAVVAEARPDAVIHLAGQTFVPAAFRDPAATFEVNLLGTLNLLQALKRSGFNGSFLYVSSGDVYGQVDEQSLPIREEMPPRPRNPYAVSKVAAELLCQQWSYTEGWRIMLARPFNHVGAGQKDSFVLASAAQQVARIRLGLQAPCLEVGDVDVTRDFLDVEDVVNAYFHILDKGTGGEIYNVCSGQERSIRELILQLAELAGVDLELVQDPARMRRAEQRRVCGSHAKLRNATGWKPNITIKQTLTTMLSDWESRVSQQ
ncbi:GDP-mannose 4,6-dehydratase [Pseudomonas panipatensis]|uniref:GDP-4-dehydro-6-deoxy-D-mannose reductase n=1 Tax=Pseudomonas panipatensis TaxID=428992 RepID=A0A1G8LUF8_9PSED|nr:GDP-mannose 4,6-dehydratase [Pseudomonas panipatensis]SDI59329.1 GDP-4-dehydro-6-deoxy-D-mannose reductase [Pseudomonas panipatensis]SMP47099.1 GDP-4-dehydro-6-deoxy-D-mannose reductase [Pseudomonas panipatensis]